jgi:hypothetical protein
MKTYWPVFRPSGLVLAAAMLVPHLAGAQAAKQATPLASPAASVAQVGVERVGQQTVVRMQGSGELTYHVTRMSDPPRVVVDFDEARLAVPSNTVASDFAPVRRVRLGQARPDQVRVVIDLLSRAEFSVERKDQSLTVSFNDQPGQEAHSQPSVVKPAQKQDRAEAKKAAVEKSVDVR